MRRVGCRQVIGVKLSADLGPVPRLNLSRRQCSQSVFLMFFSMQRKLSADTIDLYSGIPQITPAQFGIVPAGQGFTNIQCPIDDDTRRPIGAFDHVDR